MPDVGDVDPFTERGGRDEDHEVVVAEQILDHLAFATRKARVVKADEARELGTRRRSMRASATDCSREFT